MVGLWIAFIDAALVQVAHQYLPLTSDQSYLLSHSGSDDVVYLLLVPDDVVLEGEAAIADGAEESRFGGVLPLRPLLRR